MAGINAEGERLNTSFGDTSTGAKNFNIGGSGFGNPNAISAQQAKTKNILIVAVAVIAVVYIFKR